MSSTPFVLRHKRWASKYAHPSVAGSGGSWLENEVGLVFWEGMSDIDRIGLTAEVHPTPGDYSFLLKHGQRQDKYVQALVCSASTGIRRCFPATNAGYGGTFAESTEVSFLTDPIASDASFDATNAAQMTEATDRIGFSLLYNDASRGWSWYDDDGSFLLKHKTKNFIVVAEQGAGTNEHPIENGGRLVWKACPTDCTGSDFNREDYFTNGFVFENANGKTCLPPGV